MWNHGSRVLDDVRERQVMKDSYKEFRSSISFAPKLHVFRNFHCISSVIIFLLEVIRASTSVMKTCFVPMCKSDRVPKDKVSEWQRLIPRKDKVLTSNHFICEKHFSEEFIRPEVNTELYSVSTIFDHQVFNLIKYCSETVHCDRDDVVNYRIF
jgi:hypothetical protein